MTSVDFHVPTEAEWREFLTEPASYTHGAWLAACFNGALDTRFCQQLSGAARLRGRLSALIAQHYALLPWMEEQACDDLDRAVAVSSGERIGELARLSGAIYWASSIGATILASEVEVFHEHLGRELCAFALAHRDLAGPRQEFETPESLPALVLGDGWRCVEAWRRSLPESLGQRVLLKLAPEMKLEEPPGEPFAEMGPAIVRRATNLGSAHG